MYRFKIVYYSNKMILASGVCDSLDFIFDKVEEIIIKLGVEVYVLVKKEN